MAIRYVGILIVLSKDHVLCVAFIAFISLTSVMLALIVTTNSLGTVICALYVSLFDGVSCRGATERQLII